MKICYQAQNSISNMKALRGKTQNPSQRGSKNIYKETVIYRVTMVNEDMLIPVNLASSVYHRTTFNFSLKQVGKMDITLFWTPLATCQAPSHFTTQLASV